MLSAQLDAMLRVRRAARDRPDAWAFSSTSRVARVSCAWFLSSRVSSRLGARRLACPTVPVLRRAGLRLDAARVEFNRARVRLNGAGCSPAPLFGAIRRAENPNRAKSAAELAFQALSRPPCVPVPRTPPAPHPACFRGTAPGPQKQPKAAEGRAAADAHVKAKNPASQTTRDATMATAWPLRERPAEFFELRAQNRQQTSDYVSSGNFALDTIDNDDHAFHGIVFDVN